NTLKAINDGMVDARDAFPEDAGAKVPEADKTNHDPQTGEVHEGHADQSGQRSAAAESEAEPEGDEGRREAPTVPSGEAEKATPAKKAPSPSPAPAPAPAPSPAPAAAKKPAPKPKALF